MNISQAIPNKSSDTFSFYLAFGQIIALVANFLIPVFLTRFLSRSDYGVYTQFFTITTFVSTLFSLGIQSNLYFFIPRSAEDSKHKYINNTLLLLIILGAISSSIFYIFRGVFLKDTLLNQYSLLISLSVFFIMPNSIIAPLYTLKNDKKFAIFFPPLEIILRVFLIIGSALVFRNLFAILLSSVIFSCSLFIFSTYYSLYKQGNSKFTIDLSFIRIQLKYAIPFGLAVVLQTILSRIDKIICISYISPQEYAVYSVAFYGIPGIMLIYSALSQVNVINMTSAYKNGDVQSLIRLYNIFITKTLSFSFPIIAIIFLYSKEFITFFFTADYINAVIYFRIYILYFIIAMIGAGTILRSINKTNLSLRAYAYSAIVCVPLSYLLIKSYGTKGAIITAMLGLILPKLIQVYYEMRELKITIKSYIPTRNLMTIFAISLFSIIPFVLLSFEFTLSFFLTCICIAAYLSAVYLIQIKFNVFLLDKDTIKLKLKQLLTTKK